MRRADRSKMPVLFVFVDGLGVGPPGPHNPLSALEEGPLSLLGGGPPRQAPFRLLAADASLGVPGLPQSATGGAALFTGENAPSLVGRHLPGMPNGALREVIARRGLLRRARERGAGAEFANAYTPGYFGKGRVRRRSVTTVMAECAGTRLKTLEDLRRGEAVYRDFTNRFLIDAGIPAGELTPEEAGGRLGAMSGERDLLVYEYFQTDVVGHRGTLEESIRVLSPLNRFLAAAIQRLDPAADTFILSSDHGNVEDMRTRWHTNNPVPILLWGRGAAGWAPSAESPTICDVAPGILHFLPSL